LTIIFLTLFMLLEGPAWLERFYDALPASRRDRFRAIGNDVYRTVGGYVNGNIVISVLCGAVYGVTLFILGVKFALALAFIAALLDLVPLAGATIGGILVAGVAFAHSVSAGITMTVVVVGYQQLENHVLQPVIYGRTVDLSPLAVLIAVLVGATVAGLFGALVAIPIAGTLQVVIRDYMQHRAQEPETG
jgi:predicted PurR-regulated permease PerM